MLLLPASDPTLAALRARTATVLAAGSASGDVVLVDPVPGPDAAYPTRVCAALPLQGLAAPVTVVAYGEQALLLPAVARALRTRHVDVAEYVLVEPVPPAATDTWPDAPVRVFADRPDPVLGLRGWAVEPAAAAIDWRPESPR